MGSNFWSLFLGAVAFSLIASLAAGPPIAIAAEGAAAGKRTIQVSGNGEAWAAPDHATLNLAIETHAPTAASAAGLNGELAQKVSAALKARLGDKGKTWTGGYTLYPEYGDENRPVPKPRLLGYRAVNSITVETPALDLVGPLIDAAIAAGANQINSLDFNLRDDAKARSDAIGKAAKDAETQARALAEALGVKLGPIINATTVSERRPVPVMYRSAMMTANPSTPVQPGEVTVPATVSLTFEIE